MPNQKSSYTKRTAGQYMSEKQIPYSQKVHTGSASIARYEEDLKEE